jgi:hypothetical protein
MRTPAIVVVTDAPAADDVALILDALDGFNVETAGTYDGWRCCSSASSTYRLVRPCQRSRLNQTVNP